LEGERVRRDNHRLRSEALTAGAVSAGRLCPLVALRRLYPDPHRKPISPRIKCFNDATLAYYTAFAGNPWSDLVRVFTARMAVIAEKYDVGQISETQFDSEKAQAVANYTVQIMQRPYSTAKVDAAPTQAAAASKQAVATVLPKQMTCVPTFNDTNCY
jgi:hypothetical protein